MKKLVSFALMLALSAALSATAFADDNNRSVEVKTHIDPTYTVTIPANTTVNFNAEDTSFGKITLTKAQLDPGKKVEVALTASGKLKNQANTEKTLADEIRNGGTKFTSASYEKAGESTALTIHIAQADWNAAHAGDYADTVTFTISYQ